jgi:hypothetical protein
MVICFEGLDRTIKRFFAFFIVRILMRMFKTQSWPPPPQLVI